jgi:hypothetical protein
MNKNDDVTMPVSEVDTFYNDLVKCMFSHVIRVIEH